MQKYHTKRYRHVTIVTTQEYLLPPPTISHSPRTFPHRKRAPFPNQFFEEKWCIKVPVPLILCCIIISRCLKMKIGGEAGRSRPRCLMFFGRGRLRVHLDRRRGFGVGGGRGVSGRGGSSLKLIFSAVLSSLSGLPVGRREKKHPVNVSIAKR